MNRIGIIVAPVALLALAISATLSQAGDYPIDEDRVYQAVADLQDRTGDIDDRTRKEVSALVRKGARAHDDHEYEKALRSYRNALDRNPLDAAVYYEIAMTQYRLGETTAALENVIWAIALDPGLEQAYVLRGSVEDDLGFRDEALATYGRLLDINPTSHMGLLNKAIALLNAGDFGEADALLHRAREAQPDHPSAYLRLAQSARLQGFDYDEKEHLTRFLRVGKKDPRAEGARARLAELEKHEIQLNPEASFPHLELAESMARTLWRVEKHRKHYPDARGYRLTFEEERDVLQELLLSMWRQQKEKDPGATDEYLDFLLKIDDAGFFEEYVYHQKQRELGEPASQWLASHPDRNQAFLDWAKAEGLTSDDSAGAVATADEKADDQGAALEIVERDLPGFVFMLLEESELSYVLEDADEDGAGFFELEKPRWSRFRFEGDDRVDCSYDVREKMQASYSDPLGPVRTWARCFGPLDDEWKDLKAVASLGHRYEDLAPEFAGSIRSRAAGEADVHIGVTRSPAWMAYLLFKSAWPHEPRLRNAVESGLGPEPSLAEELTAMTTAVAAYRNSREAGEDEPAAPDPYMDRLVAIRDEGLLEGFVVFEVLHKSYDVSLRKLPPELARKLDRYLARFVFPKIEQAAAPAHDE